MGAAKKIEQKHNKPVSFQVIQGGKSDHNPAEDFFVYHAYDNMLEFVKFLPYHFSNWALQGEKDMDEFSKQKDKNHDDFRYFNFF